MRMHEALLYLPHMQVDPMLRVACIGCTKPFVLAHGVAVQGVSNGEPTTGFVCSEICLLAIVPVGCCGSA